MCDLLLFSVFVMLDIGLGLQISNTDIYIVGLVRRKQGMSTKSYLNLLLVGNTRIDGVTGGTQYLF